MKNTTFVREVLLFRDTGSLARKLFARMSLVLLLLLSTIGVFAYKAAKSQIDEVYDQQLIIGADVLLSLFRDIVLEVNPKDLGRAVEIYDSPLLSDEDRKTFNDYADWRMFRLWRDNILVLKSDTGPDLKAPYLESNGQFQSLKRKDDTWRIYTLASKDGHVIIQVGERQSARQVLITQIALEFAVPVFAISITSLFLIWFALRGGLAALDRLKEKLEQKRAADFSVLDIKGLPQELTPLVRTLNRLLERMEDSFRRESRFVEHAAHQLRTPLAALKIQSRLAQNATTPAELKTQLTDLTSSVDRTTRMVNQLLALASMQQNWFSDENGIIAISAGDQPSACSLKDIIAGVIAEISPVAAQKQVELAFEGEDATLYGVQTRLELALSNLVSNAVRHTPPGTEVLIRVEVGEDHSPEAGLISLEVSDHGPGLPPEYRKVAFDRFWRAPDATGHGSGLGLSIVRAAILGMGGEIHLHNRDDGKTGLVVQILLPPVNHFTLPDKP